MVLEPPRPAAAQLGELHLRPLDEPPQPLLRVRHRIGRRHVEPVGQEQGRPARPHRAGPHDRDPPHALDRHPHPSPPIRRYKGAVLREETRPCPPASTRHPRRLTPSSSAPGRPCRPRSPPTCSAAESWPTPPSVLCTRSALPPDSPAAP